MPILSCYVDDDTLRLLRIAADETGRKVEDLAESAIAEATIQFKNSRNGYEAHREKYRKAPRAMP